MKKPLVLISAFITMLLISGYASAHGHKYPNQRYNNGAHCPQCSVNQNYHKHNRPYLQPNYPSSQHYQLKREYMERNRMMVPPHYQKGYANKPPHYPNNQMRHHNRR